MRRSSQHLRTIVRERRWDLLTLGLLCTSAASLYLVGSSEMLPRTDDLPFFGADTTRIAGNLAVRGGMADRTRFHPLLQLVGQAPTRIWMIGGVGRFEAVRLTLAGFGALLVGSLYVVGRTRGLRPWCAAGPAALGGAAGASVFFFTVPETYGISAATVAVTLVIMSSWQVPPSTRTAATTIVLGGSALISGVTGPLIGLLRAERSTRRRVRAIVAATGLTIALMALQAAVFGTRLTLTLRQESEFVHVGPLAWIGRSARTALLDAWLTPRPEVRSDVVTFTGAGHDWADPRILVGLAGLVALWLLVARGAWRERSDVLVVACTGIVAVQVGLHSVYGDEPFLYAMALVPPMAGLASVAAGRTGRLIPTLCWLLVPIALAANLDHLRVAGVLSQTVG